MLRLSAGAFPGSVFSSTCDLPVTVIVVRDIAGSIRSFRAEENPACPQKAKYGRSFGVDKALNQCIMRAPAGNFAEA